MGFFNLGQSASPSDLSRTNILDDSPPDASEVHPVPAGILQLAPGDSSEPVPTGSDPDLIPDADESSYATTDSRSTASQTTSEAPYPLHTPEEPGRPDCEPDRNASHPGTLMLAIDVPLPKCGEDAPPLIALHPNSVWVGVFDGLGGAGSKSYLVEGTEYTGAYLASRAARHAVESTLATDVRDMHSNRLAHSVHSAVASALQYRLHEVEAGAPPSGLKTKMIRSLPTTMALTGARCIEGRTVVTTLWAGDSRSYLLDDIAGLQQLTVDHIKGGQQWINPRNHDGVMSNSMSASAPFDVETHEFEQSLPFVLISATDGAYGYVPGPIDFEFLILDSLRQSNSFAAWQEDLERRLVAVRGDDISFAAIALGYNNFEDLRTRFAARAETVADLRSPSVDFDEARRRLRESIEIMDRMQEREEIARWKDYAPGYFRLASKDQS